MLRAGLIRRLAAGLYSWLPLGLRVLQKVERIIREEMNRAGALELVMPVIQPAELWQESGRWTEYGPELLRIKARHERVFVAGPTHEEVITDIARRLRSVLGPAARLLPQLRRLYHRHHQLQSTGPVHFLADDAFHLLQHPQSERQPAVQARRHAPDEPGPQHQLVTEHLRFRGGLFHGVD